MSRECGDCNICCIETSIIEKDLEKPRFVPCKHLCTNGKGCSIYNDRFTICREYECGWKLGLGNDNQRPDKSGIILDIKMYNNKSYILAREVDQNAFEKNVDFLTQQIIPVLLVRYDTNSKVVQPEFKVTTDGKLEKFAAPPMIKNYKFPDEVDEKLQDEILYHWELGINYTKMQQLDKAKTNLQKCIKLLPDFVPAKHVLQHINT